MIWKVWVTLSTIDKKQTCIRKLSYKKRNENSSASFASFNKEFQSQKSYLKKTNNIFRLNIETIMQSWILISDLRVIAVVRMSCLWRTNGSVKVVFCMNKQNPHYFFNFWSQTILSFCGWSDYEKLCKFG